ncbi:MAG: serine hydrolase [Cytophagaceae bacterium]|nr:serine hydrolase [Gemmatimonadaceae bacterium]
MPAILRALRHAVLAAGVAIPATAQRPATPWPVSTPEAQQLNATPLRELVDRAKSGTYGNADWFVVVRNGQLVLNERIPRDYREISRGKKGPIGCGIDACASPADVNEFNYFHPDYHPFHRGSDLHTLQSVTKSVTATLIGIAMQQGKIRSVQAPLLSFFDGYDLSRVDPRLKKATLADLLTMRTGMEWHEQDQPLDSTNTTLQLELSKDWIRFTLAQPSDAEPGTKWVYNSGGSALMAEVVRQSTGMHADAYAKERLFGPLGIQYHWKTTPTGHPDTEGGLYLSPLDLAKIGQLYMDDGVWAGQRLLPPGWAKEATSRIVDHINPNPASPGYGYQWWRYDRRGTDVWAGNGFGGQFLLVLPAHRIVGVVNSWNVFGTPATGVLGPFIDALLDAAGVAK